MVLMTGSSGRALASLILPGRITVDVSRRPRVLECSQGRVNHVVQVPTELFGV